MRPATRRRVCMRGRVSAAETYALQSIAHEAIAAAVPEPGTWALMGLGAGLLAWRLRRERKPATVAATACVVTGSR